MGVNNELLSVVSAEYVKVTKVSSVSENTFAKTKSVLFAAGGAWEKIDITVGSAWFKENSIIGDAAGVKYECSFSGSVPAKNILYPQGILAITEIPVLVRLVLKNGAVLIIGNKRAPVRMESDFSTEKQEVVFSFSLTNTTMCMQEA